MPGTLVDRLRASRSLDEVAPEDRIIPHECYNVKIKAGDEWVAPDVFFNTVSETTTKEIAAALLFLKKTRKYSTFSEDAGTKLVCKSLDMQNGQWQDPEETRSCETCPFQKWGKDRKPPACKEVWNFVGVNLATGEPFLVSAKGASIKPVKAFLNTHFIGKLGGGAHLPLYVYRTRLRLDRPKGTYSILAPEIGDAFNADEITRWDDMCQKLASHVAASLDREDEPADDQAGGDSGESSWGGAPPPDDPDYVTEFCAVVEARRQAGRLTENKAVQALSWGRIVSEKKIREKIDAWKAADEAATATATEPDDLDSSEPIGMDTLGAIEAYAQRIGVLKAALHARMRALWAEQDPQAAADQPLEAFPIGLTEAVEGWLLRIARASAAMKSGAGEKEGEPMN